MSIIGHFGAANWQWLHPPSFEAGLLWSDWNIGTSFWSPQKGNFTLLPWQPRDSSSGNWKGRRQTFRLCPPPNNMLGEALRLWIHGRSLCVFWTKWRQTARVEWVSTCNSQLMLLLGLLIIVSILGSMQWNVFFFIIHLTVFHGLNHLT